MQGMPRQRESLADGLEGVLQITMGPARRSPVRMMARRALSRAWDVLLLERRQTPSQRVSIFAQILDRLLVLESYIAINNQLRGV